MLDHKSAKIIDNNLPIKITQIPYDKKMGSRYFAAIEQDPWSCFLHSAAKEHINSRFDIIVSDPLATLCHFDGKNILQDKNGDIVTNNKDPFKCLEDLQSSLLPKLSSFEDIPFVGGALGYFSYDLGRQVEHLPIIAQKDLDIPEMAIGIYDWAIIIDHKKKSAVIIEPKNSDRISWLNSKQNQLQANHSNKKQFCLTSAWQSNMTKQSYQEKFSQVQTYLQSGDCYQINLAQRFMASYQGSEWHAYFKLAQINQAPFSAFMRFENNAILSLSPERFIKVEDRQIETKPIKGTRPRNTDPIKDLENIQDLKTASKDNAENLMIVDLLRNDIGRVARAGSVKVPQLFEVESFPAVHHLVSTVTGELDYQYSNADLLKSCFPGGSITGAPKVRAMEIIEELEPHRRSLYCGSIGYISRCGKMDTNISIRTLVCSNKTIYAWAGGGLVADSQIDSEYQETLDKLSKILPILEDIE